MADERFLWAMRIIFILFSFITLICSSTILFIILFYWKTKYRSVPNLFVCNSSVSLLFYTVAVILQIPYLFRNAETLVEDRYCKFRAFLLCFACAVKCLSYLIQAISRWFIIMYSRHPALRTYRIHFLMILCSWLISLIVCLILFLFPTAYQYEAESHMCVLTTKSFFTCIIPLNLLFFLPLMIIIVLYGRILWRTTLLQQNHANDYTQIYRTLVTLVLIVIIAGIPYFASAILNWLGQRVWWLYSVSIACMSLEAMLESLVIFFNHRPVKEQCHEMIFCCGTSSNEVLPVH